MQKRFYLDTSIWRDYFEDRTDGLRPLGEFAFRFMKKCEEKGDLIIVSNAVRKELLDYFSIEKVNQVFSGFKDLIIEIDYSEEQAKESYRFWTGNNKNFRFGDILHSIIARDNKAIIVTMDKHFGEIGIAECWPPEKLL